MTVAREPEVKRQCRDVTCVREFGKGSSQPELRKIAVERDTLDPAEDIRELRRRRPDCPREGRRGPAKVASRNSFVRAIRRPVDPWLTPTTPASVPSPMCRLRKEHPAATN